MPNSPNYEFWINTITFSGHIISSEGIMVDPKKVVIFKRCPRPTIPTDIGVIVQEVVWPSWCRDQGEVNG